MKVRVEVAGEVRVRTGVRWRAAAKRGRAMRARCVLCAVCHALCAMRCVPHHFLRQCRPHSSPWPAPHQRKQKEGVSVIASMRSAMMSLGLHTCHGEHRAQPQ